MAAPTVRPTDVQGGPLAVGIMRDPTFAAAVFAHLDYADALPLRAACRGTRDAVAAHPWSLPIPPPGWPENRRAAERNYVCTATGLTRWRACFPVGRSLMLGSAPDGRPLSDADLAQVGEWRLAGVHMSLLFVVTQSGLAAVCTPALTALSLYNMPHLSSADVAAAVVAAPRLHTLSLTYAGELRDADLVAFGGIHTLTLGSTQGAGFTGRGLAALASARSLTVWLPLRNTVVGLGFGLDDDGGWPGDAFSGLRHLTHLLVGVPDEYLRSVDFSMPVRGRVGLFAGVPPSLRSVDLGAVSLAWRADEEPDGGAALLAPLAGVPRVSLRDVSGVDDRGLAALTGVQELVLSNCHNVTCEDLRPLAGSLQRLSMEYLFNESFTGAGLACLTELTHLELRHCSCLHASVLQALMAGRPTLRHVSVAYRESAHALDSIAQAVLGAAAAGGAGWAFTRTQTDGTRTWTATREEA